MSGVVHTKAHERALIVDVVRGFALIGVLIANFTGFTSQQVPDDILDSISAPFDNILNHINTVFIEWKFMTLFSILFGYGFGLLLSGLERKGMDVNEFFLYRMGWLFVIGVIHTCFWWFDVLHFYAVSGALLLLFKKSSNRSILIWSLLFMFVIPFGVSILTSNHSSTFSDTDLRHSYEQFKNGSLYDLVRTNLVGYYKMFILSGGDAHDISETLGRFLFGYYLLRVQLFDRVAQKRKVFSTILYFCTPVAFSYLLKTWLDADESSDAAFIEPLRKIGILATTTVYVCLLVRLFIRYPQGRIFKVLQALGKMTLTNYLLISTVNIILLYGIGFGLLGELPMRTIWFIAIVWLAVAIAGSLTWLQRYRYGPVEWIWRQLSYRRRLPLRR
jgi:uncharacterized protein